MTDTNHRVTVDADPSARSRVAAYIALTKPRIIDSESFKVGTTRFTISR